MAPGLLATETSTTESSYATFTRTITTGLHTPKISVYHHSLITISPHAFKFQGAASLQLLPPHITSRPEDENVTSANILPLDKFLIVSPYNTVGNLLDLDSLDDACSLLARALTIMQPVRQDFATAPYDATFNWDAMIMLLRKLAGAQCCSWPNLREFYIIEFRSRRQPDLDLELNGLLDIESHREAMSGGGLLKYWFGDVDSEGRNLATCIWRSREDAIRGGSGSWHQRAKKAASSFYCEIKVVSKRLVIEEGMRKWSIRDW